MPDLKTLILSYLKQQRLMALATSGDKGPAVSMLYFAFDKDFNIYFVCSPKSLTGENIASNGQVACAITDSHQKVTDKKVGIQLIGKAKQITDESKAKTALKLWNRFNPGIDHRVNFENMKKGEISTRTYVIKPSVFKFFNQELYGEKEAKIFKLHSNS